MRISIPYIIEGEVLDIQSFAKGSRKFLRYICKVSMPDGTVTILPNCAQSTMFGGVDDYLQFRSRASSDSGVDTQTNKNDEKNSAQIGDRVYIAFIGGNIQKPIIVGYAQHPNQTYEFDDQDPTSSDFQPNLIFKYLGVKATIDDEGQLRVIHRGAPIIDYKPKSSGALGNAMAAADAASAASGESGGPGKDVANPAVTPKDSSEITLFEFLNGGVFRLRDAEGQIVEIDRTKQRIYISNNDLKSTQNPDDPGVNSNQLASNSTDAEYILWDKAKQMILLNARKLLELYSFDRRKDVTEGDYVSKVKGDVTWTINGDETKKIDGDANLTVGGDQKSKVSGDWTIQVTGDATVTAGGGATLKLSGGQVGLGGKAAELLDLFDQLMTELGTFLTNLGTETHTGNLGYPTSPPLNVAQYVQSQTSIKKIQTLLGQIKGGI